MAELQNVFSWSRSRDRVFQECRRKYWFQHYGSWGGWDARSEPRTREIYVLKQLQSRWMWAGDRVHHAIEDVLKAARNGSRVPLEKALAATLDAMRKEWKASKEREYRKAPKKVPGLFEHEYLPELPREKWAAVGALVETCLKNFYAGPLAAEMFGLTRERWLTVEDMEQFDFEGTPVWVKIDAAFRAEGGGARIVDWKTGRKQEEGFDEIQLGCYTVFARQKWGFGPGAVSAELVYLAAGERVEVPMTEEAVERTRAAMRASIAAMREVLADPAANAAREADFPYTDELKLCRSCNFQKVCEGAKREKQVMSAED